jgi:hypothetical protein
MYAFECVWLKLMQSKVWVPRADHTITDGLLVKP